jgi:hypothetical protein
VGKKYAAHANPDIVGLLPNGEDDELGPPVKLNG